MFSRAVFALTPFFGRLTVTSEIKLRLPVGSIFVANHDSMADPAVVLTALRRLDLEPVVMATAGLWRVPLLGRALTRGGHIPVHRRTAHAALSLDAAAEALAGGRHVLLYGEGGLPRRKDAAPGAPEPFRTGLARLAQASGALVVPVGHAGARRISSGSPAKQVAGVLTAPLRRPRCHVHIGAPLRLPAETERGTAAARTAVTEAWRTAVRAAGEKALAHPPK
ncbi:1-acyl-sn-glycerol-3-phosphate acyltransferase [Streptomyces sp. NBC_01275]|uniref:lysophospholipid acyltransferase family protein n=1 Tax=Streptomyces sp. NBC_01275 TaxID=2903807 RepID=UPI0022541FA3|nr:lysophospholipid acyltransferase family protein [Streptomyces sp. NBC_01275]MCX4767202.1 1-acyl-sn-glycerol-3-phosphate acyltransferase [Streptomyces sp. NBC_01275]